MGYPGNTTQLTVFCFRNKNCNVSKKNYGFTMKPSPPEKKEGRVQFYQTTFDFLVRSQEGVFVFLTFSDEAQDKQVKTERAQRREKKETENIH